jgi:hypothetical protein
VTADLGNDLPTVVLGLGVLALAVTATMMLLEVLPSTQQRRTPPQQRSLSSGAAQAVAEARARAAAATEVLGLPSPVSGQIIDLSDDPGSDRQMSTDEAAAIAVHYAETDPQRVAEVISQWIRADSVSEEPPAPAHSPSAHSRSWAPRDPRSASNRRG